jgi:7,8-dihydro-6-hydroxymethylpterin-pyrophosphokinase
LPHPRAHKRAFVLLPLAEIAGAVTLPGQIVTIAKLATNISTSDIITRI